jgi:serine/threonine-protein kinase
MAEPNRDDEPGETKSLKVPGDALEDGLAVAFGPWSDPPPGRSVLKTLSTVGVDPPRVLLRDTDPAAEPALVDRGAPELPPRPGPDARYQLLGEIGRGGMGAVLKGRDADLGRDLAIKVLLEKYRDQPEMTRRFVEEAQIAGQLQHPGVVPVYELGTFGDRRPYFTMKLVKGRTLAAQLAERSSPADDLPRFLGVFEAVAQTVAYAHARGVIHRDLKPANVMVGGFGEVQVMDWGLAKVLPKGGGTDEANLAGRETLIQTARSGTGADASRSGSVLGTPAYMAPEQARGEVERIDERADVFALGSMLCEVLTGQPAFTGRESSEVLRRSARGETVEALARLDASGADAELVGLARDCLAVEPRERPRDARAVSERMTAYLAGVQERLRVSELVRARAEARAVEERKRRKLQLGLAAAVLALAGLGGLGAAFEMQRRHARYARVAGLLAETTTLGDQARRQPDEPSGWREALAAARRVEDALAGGGDPEAARRLAALVADARAGLGVAVRDARLQRALLDARAGLQEAGPTGTDAAYARAFADSGLDLKTLGVAETAGRLRTRRRARVIEIASYLDHWSSVSRLAGRPAAEWRKPLEVARAADPDECRGRLRGLLAAEDPKDEAARLRGLADSAEAAELPAPTALLLADALGRAGEAEASVALMRKAAARHPEDVWLHFTLAGVMERLRSSQRDEAVLHYTAARALRPETAHDLAHLLDRMGRGAEAEVIFRDLTRRQPDDVRHLACFGRHLKDRGRAEEAATVLDRAIAAGRAAIRLEPDSAEVHFNLGNALYATGDMPGAIAANRAVIRLEPASALAHINLGLSLRASGDLPGAIAAYREALRLQPDSADAYIGLGFALRASGDLPGAIAASRTAIRLKPEDARAHNNLGAFLASSGDMPGAIAAYREALRLQPENALAHAGLGSALRASGDLPGAIAEYRAAIRLKPEDASVHINLGSALRASGDLPGAIAANRAAIHLQPDSAEAHCNLGQALRQAGDFAGALAELRRGHELGSRRPGWPYPSAEWVRQTERMAALAGRLETVLGGEAGPADDAERLALAQMCYDTRRYAAAARLWAEALAADPKLADDRRAQHRYNAACAAALGAAGQGRDEPWPDESSRARLRAQALGWLRAELAIWSKLSATAGKPNALGRLLGAVDRDTIRATLKHWRVDPDLAGVRDALALVKLPAAERDAWRALWVDVDALLRDAAFPADPFRR